MKTLNVVFLILVSSTKVQAQEVKIVGPKGSEQTTRKNTSSSNKRNNTNKFQMVDMGLSVYWATCNVGATRFDMYGSFYVWGNVNEITSETVLFKDRPKHYPANICISGNAEVDPARKIMGGKWRTPTWQEMKELIDNTYYTWTNEYDGGAWLTSKINGNKIYLPACGVGVTQFYDFPGVFGGYWTSTAAINASNNESYYLSIGENTPDNNVYPKIVNENRGSFFSIRAVMDK